ncbi:MAG: cobalamin B12-binding domain-containing protein [Ardenticatenaceae bacterium]|nr:cobalamin B12-binding domain-containing protein [Ardenticatenaceae bacterium]
MSETDESRKIRIIIAKPGLDGHDRGAKVVARALRDAGFEVIYTGLRQTPEMIVEAALQEDADAIGLSLLSGAHMTIFPRVRQLMDEQGLENVLLFGGGIISDGDAQILNERYQVGGVFGPGTSLETIVRFVRDEMRARSKLA